MNIFCSFGAGGLLGITPAALRREHDKQTHGQRHGHGMRWAEMGYLIYTVVKCQGL